jgi:hypothetical protein
MKDKESNISNKQIQEQTLYISKVYQQYKGYLQEYNNRIKKRYGMHFHLLNYILEWVNGQFNRILNYCICILNILLEELNGN